MALSLAPAHLKRYAELARLFLKYGRGPLAEDLSRDLPGEGREVLSDEADPEQLARDLEALGPTFIKLGQLLSTRADLLPTPYLEALSRLQDRVEPFPFEEVEAILAEELHAKVADVFDDFDPIPIAAASLGQVRGVALIASIVLTDRKSRT
jgi:predicted unusual protein kinase regulating ubiquinone biosynthesis (AarF/ABC1/UbiB family)